MEIGSHLFQNLHIAPYIFKQKKNEHESPQLFFLVTM